MQGAGVAPQNSEIPKEVLEVLHTQPMGYLSVKSGKGEIYCYPMVFVVSGLQFYLITPIASSKLRFMRANPDVSFLVDNKDVTLGSVGAMVQGSVKIFSIAKTITSILSVGPNIIKYTRKYPGRFTFYARGKQLPDERKLYKYRLVRLDPSKFLYWVGYKFGKYVPSKGRKDRGLESASDDEKMESFATLLKGADEEFTAGEVPAQKPEWTMNLDAAVENGVISKEEREAMGSFRGFLRQAAAESAVGPSVTDDERRFLKKWKSSGK